VRQERPVFDDSTAVIPDDDYPSHRAAIRDGRITLNRWNPALLSGGPARAGMATIDAALADLRLLDDELVVCPVAHVAWSAAAEAALLTWARVVGYRRVWLPGSVVDLAGDLAVMTTARVQCPTCGASWEDDTVVFWERVRDHGWFPGLCLACGGSLPEWSCEAVSDGRTAATTPAGKVSDRGRRERHP
jgi:hypothetical protein